MVHFCRLDMLKKVVKCLNLIFSTIYLMFEQNSCLMWREQSRIDGSLHLF